MRIDRDSYGSLALVYAGCIAVGFAILHWIKLPYIAWPGLVLVVWFAVWQTFFFSVPKRKCAGGAGKVTSVADGRVVIVEDAVEQEYLKTECVQVSVYMNFFDIHANFWPCDGTVTHYKYNPGKHLFAYRPKASIENEHTVTCIRLDNGKTVVFKQIAGGFARRITCHAQKGSQVKAGEQCGIIKFGSRIDIFLPKGTEVQVKVGELVRSCETVLADLS